MIAGPGDNKVTVGDGRLRTSQAEREKVIGTLKAAFVQGRLTEDELDTRAGHVYASRTYAELAEATAEVTADIPAEPPGARPPRDPWRATKVAWRVVYALILPGILTVIVLPGGPAPTTTREVVVYVAVTYALFWILGVFVMVASRRAKRSGGQQPLRSAPCDGE